MSSFLFGFYSLFSGVFSRRPDTNVLHHLSPFVDFLGLFSEKTLRDGKPLFF